jgi:3-keto-5-aminohexanoate cleavage enzyme
MEPLIITATPNICWLKPDVNYPHSVDEIVQEAIACEKAGASIFHIHGEGKWVEVIRGLRDNTNLIIQCGMSSLDIPARMDVFYEKADMISIITSHHDEAFTGVDFHVLHPREELEEYARLSRTHGVKLEYENWHTGSIWNLNYLIERGQVDAPYFTTCFFGWPGGSWSPATLEEYTSRRKIMPKGSIVNVSVMGKDQTKMLAASIVSGDHVRVGTEDNPYDRTGQISTTHDLVAEIAAVSQSLGRPIASPTEARRLLGFQP